jgi:hypothetical protein
MEPLAPVTARMIRRLELEGADSAGGVTRVIIADPAEVRAQTTMIWHCQNRKMAKSGAD